LIRTGASKFLHILQEVRSVCKTRNQFTAFPQLLHTFFHDWLTVQRNTSHRTVLAYRDSWRLFLRFVAARAHRPVAPLELTHRSATAVLAFLAYLEQERHVTIATRHCRLAALRRCFAGVADYEPLAAAQCAAVLRLPTTRSPRRDVCYLAVEEVAAILAQPARSTLEGQRDHALFAC
jgi:site-specific recombinase XerD